jgi:hypothetical protein
MTDELRYLRMTGTEVVGMTDSSVMTAVTSEAGVTSYTRFNRHRLPTSRQPSSIMFSFVI